MAYDDHFRQAFVPVSLVPDPVIDTYKSGIDVTLLRKNLSHSIDERLDNHAALQEFARELREAGRRNNSGDNMTYRGHVKNGQILLDDPAKLPEGAAVRVEVREEPVRISRPQRREKLRRIIPINLPGGALADELIQDRR